MEYIAVIDTETNWLDKIMSVGVVIAETANYEITDKKYYIVSPECNVGGIYSSVLYDADKKDTAICSRKDAVTAIERLLKSNNVNSIYAYNAGFDYSHMPELSDFAWYDIMRLAAYRQYNRYIPETALCCKTGRLKCNYGVEPITRMITGNSEYHEIHNALRDAEDELAIMRGLGHAVCEYKIARIQ